MFSAVVAALLVAAATATGPHTGERLLLLQVPDAKTVKLMEDLQNTHLLKLDFWGHPHEGQSVLVRVPVKSQYLLSQTLKAQGVKYEVAVEDLQTLIDAETASNTLYARKGANYYMHFDEMVRLMNKLAKKYPDIATLYNIGKSFEGRDLLVLKLSSGGANKKAAFIHSGFHSREWIASASTVWMMNEMATNHDQRNISAALDKYDWYFMPMSNPDGYEYSRLVNRFWRKTRSKNFYCDGADPNRNWDAHFGGVGTSGFPCSDIYRGRFAFSEPETKAQSEFLLSLIKGNGVSMYFDIHCFSQLWFTPFGNDPNNKPADYNELLRVANIGKKAIHNYGGRDYTVGQPGSILYSASGGAYDWAKINGVKYSYALELRPEGAGNGMNGFVTPAAEIPDSGLETMTGILAAAAATLE